MLSLSIAVAADWALNVTSQSINRPDMTFVVDLALQAYYGYFFSLVEVCFSQKQK